MNINQVQYYIVLVIIIVLKCYASDEASAVRVRGFAYSQCLE